MKQVIFPLGVFSVLLMTCGTALADEQKRHVVGKLTAVSKPAVRVLNAEEREALNDNLVSLDLSVDPEQVICRKERVSVNSRLMTNRCKTVAQFRQERELEKNQLLQYNNSMQRARLRRAVLTRQNPRVSGNNP